MVVTLDSEGGADEIGFATAHLGSTSYSKSCPQPPQVTVETYTGFKVSGSALDQETGDVPFFVAIN